MLDQQGLEQEVGSRGLAPTEKIGAEIHAVDAEDVFGLHGHFCGQLAGAVLPASKRAGSDAKPPRRLSSGKPVRFAVGP
jgi:hypothetical protein